MLETAILNFSELIILFTYVRRVGTMRWMCAFDDKTDAS